MHRSPAAGAHLRAARWYIYLAQAVDAGAGAVDKPTAGRMPLPPRVSPTHQRPLSPHNRSPGCAQDESLPQDHPKVFFHVGVKTHNLPFPRSTGPTTEVQVAPRTRAYPKIIRRFSTSVSKLKTPHYPPPTQDAHHTGDRTCACTAVLFVDLQVAAHTSPYR